MANRNGKVTPIRASEEGVPVWPIPEVRKYLNEACDKILEAQSIASVAASAAVSGMPADEHCTRTTMQLVHDMLDRVAAMIEPDALALFAAKAEFRRVTAF
jgi:hypothetical protein